VTEALDDVTDGRISRRRARRRIGAASLVAVVALGALIARGFVWPGSDVPRRADAVVVLSGDHGERLPVGLRLVRSGVAPVLVLDGGPDSEEATNLCKGGMPFEVVCLRPDPDGTRPEAQAAGRLAADRGWRSVVVVTSTHHGTRAGVLFRRCVKGSVHVVRARPPFGRATVVQQTLREVAATAFVLLIGPRSC
jgi:uncharacterized SAM-binding protein YcdF (DUF218 family)